MGTIAVLGLWCPGPTSDFGRLVDQCGDGGPPPFGGLGGVGACHGAREAKNSGRSVIPGKVIAAA